MAFTRRDGGGPVIEALLQAERLLVVGLVDQAERIYASALEQDPLNAIAVVGLARVALERGDDRLAYQQARRALEIDPENAAAIRLELRLAEVLSRRDADQAAAEADRGIAADSEPAGDAAPPAADEPSNVPNPDARPSEQFVFNRNPSMADHRAAEERRNKPGETSE
jgi:tetratricopeptide (TPR) repeat protein